MSKRILNADFKILKPKRSSSIQFPIFLFEDVESINLEEVKAVVFSHKRLVLFFIFADEDFVVVPLSKAATSFFTKKQLSNIVLYNCQLSDVTEDEGRIVSLHYEM
jgi:hypothetical protein